MKKHACFLLFSICLSQYANAQTSFQKERFVLDTAYKYEVIDSCVFEMLDTLTSDLHSCIFDALNRDYFFYLYVCEKGNVVRSQIYPYYSHTPLIWYKNEDRKDKGFFSYTDQLVLLIFEEDVEERKGVRGLFKRIDSVEIVECPVLEEHMPDVSKGIENISVSYDLGKCEIIKRHLCTGDSYYMYKIMEGDTWERIAEKFATTEENIRTLDGKYDESEKPKEGHIIMVYCKIVDGALEVRRERTRLDPVQTTPQCKSRRKSEKNGTNNWNGTDFH